MARLQALPGADAPVVRWGVVVIVLILGWAVLITPYIEWRAQQRQLIDIRAGKAARILALEASAKVWQQASLTYGKDVKKIVEALFQGSSYAASQAALLKVIHDNLTKYHLSLGSQRLLDSKKEAHLGQRVAAYFRVRGTLADVLGFVDAVARDSKLIVLDRLYIGRGFGGKALLQFQATGFRLVSHGE